MIIITISSGYFFLGHTCQRTNDDNMNFDVLLLSYLCTYLQTFLISPVVEIIYRHILVLDVPICLCKDVGTFKKYIIYI